MNENWRSLKIGDFVKIVRLPSDYDRNIQNYDDDLIGIYDYIKNNNFVLRVENIDEYGNPWVEFIVEDDEGWSHHSLAINDDSWECVNDPKS